MSEEISFKSFRLVGNRVLSENSMIPLDSVSFVSFGERDNPYKFPLLVIGAIVIIAGFIITSLSYDKMPGILTIIVGILFIVGALYKKAQYQITSDSGRSMMVESSSNEGENIAFGAFATRLLDAKEKYMKK